jgi:hypothetical protein
MRYGKPQLNIAKRAWRSRILECYRAATGNCTLPAGSVFFTLGADATAKESEFHQLRLQFLEAYQYVSVDLRAGVRARNGRIKSATFLHGEFSNKLAEFCEQHTERLGVVSCDMMCRLLAAVPTIRGVLHTLRSRPFDVVAFNVNCTRRDGSAITKRILKEAGPDFSLLDDFMYDNNGTRMRTVVLR